MKDTIRKSFVWNKGVVVDGYDSSKVRKDICGAWIIWDHYGKKTVYSWAIDHIIPKALGGKDLLTNFQPLQWKNNLAKGDNLMFKPAVVSRGSYNVSFKRKLVTLEMHRGHQLLRRAISAADS